MRVASEVSPELGAKDTPNITLVWADFFEMPEDEKTARVQRLLTEMQNLLLTPERAVTMIAKTEGIEDIEVLKEEIKKLSPIQDRWEQAFADTENAEQSANGAGNKNAGEEKSPGGSSPATNRGNKR